MNLDTLHCLRILDIKGDTTCGPFLPFDGSQLSQAVEDQSKWVKNA